MWIIARNFQKQEASQYNNSWFDFRWIRKEIQTKTTRGRKRRIQWTLSNIEQQQNKLDQFWWLLPPDRHIDRLGQRRRHHRRRRRRHWPKKKERETRTINHYARAHDVAGFRPFFFSLNDRPTVCFSSLLLLLFASSTQFSVNERFI